MRKILYKTLPFNPTFCLDETHERTFIIQQISAFLLHFWNQFGFPPGETKAHFLCFCVNATSANPFTKSLYRLQIVAWGHIPPPSSLTAFPVCAPATLWFNSAAITINQTFIGLFKVEGWGKTGGKRNYKWVISFNLHLTRTQWD